MAWSSGTGRGHWIGTMQRRRLAVMATTLAVLAGAAVALMPEPASTAVGYQPVPNDSWGTDGTAEEVLLQGGTVYVGGAFTAAVHGGTSIIRKNLAAFDEGTGGLVGGFAADTDGTVETLATYGGALFIGGTFTTVKGVSRRNLAKLDLVTGNVDPAFNPSPNSSVFDLWVNGTTLYLSGDFNTVAGQSRVQRRRDQPFDHGIVGGCLRSVRQPTRGRPSPRRRTAAPSTSEAGSRRSTTRPSITSWPSRPATEACSPSTTPASSRPTRPHRPPTSSTSTCSSSQVFVAIGGQHFNAVRAWASASQAEQGHPPLVARRRRQRPPRRRRAGPHARRLHALLRLPWRLQREHVTADDGGERERRGARP